MRHCSCVTSGVTARLLAGSLIASVLLPRVLDGSLAPRSDHTLFALLAIGLGLLWARYRREDSQEAKIRLAALAALSSVVFLSVTSAMPWLSVNGIVIRLGQEGLFAISGPDAAAFEVQRWQVASGALRMGQVTALSLLLPALIWLLVDPRHRAAQAATAVGASVAGFTLMAALLYVESIPAWLNAERTWTADIALLASGTIVVAAVLVVRQSFALLHDARGLPRAYRR